MKPQGFSYIEIMVALLVLGLCAVPAADAIRTGAQAAQVAAAKAEELRCLKSRMESVLAEPYERLAADAEAKFAADPPPSAYSLPAGAPCAPLFVHIEHYERRFQAAGRVLDASNSTADERAALGMLRIIVAPADPAVPGAAAAAADGRSYSFTTLVIR